VGRPVVQREAGLQRAWTGDSVAGAGPTDGPTTGNDLRIEAVDEPMDDDLLRRR
jgi:hypothetical protein